MDLPSRPGLGPSLLLPLPPALPASRRQQSTVNTGSPPPSRQRAACSIAW